MKVSQLETFLEVARTGSFSRAATRLHLTQSTVSARIRNLESTVGAPLFDRLGRQIKLTYVGAALVPRAESVVNAIKEIKLQMIGAENLSGTLRIGVAELIAVSWLPQFTRAVYSKHPNITLEFDVSLNPSMISQLRDGSLDLLLCCPPSNLEGLVEESLGHVPFGWMVGSSVLVNESAEYTARQLSEIGIVLQGNSYTSAVIMDWFGDDKPCIKATCNSMAAIRALVYSGVGAGLLPITLFQDDLQSGSLKLVRSSVPAPIIDFCLLHRGDQAGNVLIDVVKNIALSVNTFV